MQELRGLLLLVALVLGLFIFVQRGCQRGREFRREFRQQRFEYRQDRFEQRRQDGGRWFKRWRNQDEQPDGQETASQVHSLAICLRYRQLQIDGHSGTAANRIM